MPDNQAFTDAQARVKTLKSVPSNNDLLELYSLYKQATSGDASGARPGIFDMKGRAKFDAWTGKKGVERDDAEKQYIAVVERLSAKG